MEKITFILDDNLLITHIIENSNNSHQVEQEYSKDIVALQNYAYKLNKDIYRLLEGKYLLHNHIIKNGIVSYSQLGTSIDTYLDNIKNSNEFKLLKEQTNRALEKVKKEWERNEDITHKYIEDLNIKIAGIFKVFITHPGLNSGWNIGNNVIQWTYKSYYPNCNTVYIWHELLHSVLGTTGEEHALIELITDNELKRILNGTSYPPTKGHKHLEEIRNKILNKWEEYLNLDITNRDFNKLKRSITSS